jgi:uncharacterized glyoxalase superfamily protein PhnB
VRLGRGVADQRRRRAADAVGAHVHAGQVMAGDGEADQGGKRGAADQDPTRALGKIEQLPACRIEIGDSCIMLADEYPDMGFRSPKAIGGTPVTLHLYVDDVDAVARQAVAAGAREVRPVKDQFYGDRTGTVEDPFGHVWHIATHKEDLSPGELKRRADAAMKQGG